MPQRVHPVLAVIGHAGPQACHTHRPAEAALDTASDRCDAAERALDEAREERAQARRDRYAARQAYERASATADRLARRVRETSERLDRAAELVATLQRGKVRATARSAPRLGPVRA